MSRSQRNARMRPATAPPGESSTAPTYPAELTEKDGATNIAGDVNNFTAQDYTGMVVVDEDK